MKPNKITAYVCLDCGELHPNEEDAEMCCPRNVEEVDAWECDECNTIYEDKQEAKDCCK